jgi:hypothetical protein
VAPTLVKAANGCVGDSLRITVSGDAGTTMAWYKKQTDANPFYTGSSYFISNVQKPDTFYVRSINGTCTSGFLTIYQKASAYPTSLTTKNDSICSKLVLVTHIKQANFMQILHFTLKQITMDVFTKLAELEFAPLLEVHSLQVCLQT